MAIRKHDQDVPRDASGHRIKDNNLVVVSGVNHEVAHRSFTKTNKVYTLTISNGGSGDTYTLTVNGATTAAIAHNATSAQVQAALVLAAGDSYTSVVTGGAGVHTITFIGKYKGSDAPVLTVDDTLMDSGGSASADLVLTTHGSTVDKVIAKDGSSITSSASTVV